MTNQWGFRKEKTWNVLFRLSHCVTKVWVAVVLWVVISFQLFNRSFQTQRRLSPTVEENTPLNPSVSMKGVKIIVGLRSQRISSLSLVISPGVIIEKGKQSSPEVERSPLSFSTKYQRFIGGALSKVVKGDYCPTRWMHVLVRVDNLKEKGLIWPTFTAYLFTVTCNFPWSNLRQRQAK